MLMVIYSTEFEDLTAWFFYSISVMNDKYGVRRTYCIPFGIARRVKYPIRMPRRPMMVLRRPNAIVIAVSEETGIE
jgi:hypothetical protein